MTGPQHAPSGEPEEDERPWPERYQRFLDPDQMTAVERAYQHQVARLRADLAQRTAELARVREELAEWLEVHKGEVELRGMLESHMDMARMQWECTAELQQARAVVSAARAEVARLGDQGSDLAHALVALDATPAAGEEAHG